MAVHVLLVDAESAFVVEKVELDLFEDVQLVNDHSCARFNNFKYFLNILKYFIKPLLYPLETCRSMHFIKLARANRIWLGVDVALSL